MSKHIGSSFDDFLEEEGLLAGKLMEEQRLSKAEMARRMGTSRSALERLLDPENASVTLLTLERAAKALGKSLRIELAA